VPPASTVGRNRSSRWDAALCVIDGSGAAGALFDKPSPMGLAESVGSRPPMTSMAARQHAQDQCPDARKRSCVDWDKWPPLGPSAIKLDRANVFWDFRRPRQPKYVGFPSLDRPDSLNHAVKKSGRKSKQKHPV
jgi:hypothetical protein